MSEKLKRGMQENLLVLLTFDDTHAKIIRNSAEPNLFEGMYKEVVGPLYEYIDSYNKPPKEHIEDLLAPLLERDSGKADAITDLLANLYVAKETVDPTFVMDSLAGFLRQQHLKLGIVEAAQLLQTESQESLERAEEILNESMQSRLQLFDPGVFLDDTDKSFSFFDITDESFTTGVPILDDRGLGPIRGGLHLFVAPPKRGKTWWMVNLGKRALIEKYKVCHVSLEMSEERMAMRYYQSLFNMAKRGDAIEISELMLDKHNEVEDIERVNLVPSLYMQDPEVQPKLRQKIDKWGTRLHRLVIKSFPTGSLTVRGLRAYLDSLESSQGFVPDLLIVDYADIMKVDTNNYRHDLGNLYKDLRGVAVERNFALATASQTNRSGVTSKRVDESSIAEDFSKIATADAVVVYNQSEVEKALGIARLIVTNARNDEDRIEALVSQNYTTGQFVLKSAYIGRSYEEILESLRALTI